MKGVGQSALLEGLTDGMAGIAGTEGFVTDMRMGYTRIAGCWLGITRHHIKTLDSRRTESIPMQFNDELAQLDIIQRDRIG